eukprot:TRINITY_DN16561_c0_g1_i1.p1 TRINITY_DN16561_c0_g1~~TRINITY_DN16561_c0_g1_i1.p1  ORF type:complete len:640 (-),score=188.54 TRINITY_DN16561_c0_g1_i1:108-2027(-)
MARRPDEARGSLIFQEGKCIEGDYYIVAVYDDPATCTISFSAYELENDCTYTYPLTYSQFDSLFQYDSELMNPSNKDGRFHWVIERLDFVQDKRGQKVLCLGEEATAEPDEEEELVEDVKKKPEGAAPANVGGKIDAATRAKLLKELDTHDDAKLHAVLVKSESARKKFVADLHSKRHLEQLKASQRLQKADEEREARLAKLETIKRLQQQKADAHKANEEAKKSTLAQLEVLMKQKEAQAIRRLIQEKDAADRGMGREKDAARQRRKMQERSAKEVNKIEAERAQQLARKRDEQVEKRDQLVVKRNRQIGETIREEKAAKRENEIRLRKIKDKMIEEEWTEKMKVRNAKDDKVRRFKVLEEVREKKEREREKRRAKEEEKQLVQVRAAAVEEKDATLKRRDKMRREYLLQWKIDASDRAQSSREQVRRQERRDAKIHDREEARLRKFRESQFVDTMRSTRSFSPTKGGDGVEDVEVTDLEATGGNQAAQAERTMLPPQMGTQKTEAGGTKTYEQIERDRRQAERNEKHRQEEAKKGKMQQLSGRNPNVVEVLRIRDWRFAEEKRMKALEDARVKKEVALEKRAKEMQDKSQKRDTLWEELEVPRKEREAEREKARLQAICSRIKALPMGRCLPNTLVY